MKINEAPHEIPGLWMMVIGAIELVVAMSLAFTLLSHPSAKLILCLLLGIKGAALVLAGLAQIAKERA